LAKWPPLPPQALSAKAAKVNIPIDALRIVKEPLLSKVTEP
jgi:hypothetical protein